MSAYLFAKGKVENIAKAFTQRRWLRTRVDPDFGRRPDWRKSLDDPTGFYLQCYRYFHQQLPAELREHRAYFCANRRGFGEDPFHTMWFFLFREFKPSTFLEIGIYRGQTLSLAARLSGLNGVPCAVQGISPFTPAGDSVTKYLQSVDYLEDTLANFKHFNLPAPPLLRAYSTDPAAVELIAGRAWDIIYIDGNHDYEIVLKDWEVCSRAVKPGGLIVLDDSGLGTKFRPPPGATGGHPGPSRLAGEIDPKTFAEILQVGHNRVFQKPAADQAVPACAPLPGRTARFNHAFGFKIPNKF